jgi:hypothetical protein
MAALDGRVLEIAVDMMVSFPKREILAIKRLIRTAICLQNIITPFDAVFYV